MTDRSETTGRPDQDRLPVRPHPSAGGNNHGGLVATEKRTVLVIDDESQTRRRLRSLVEAAGYCVHEAETWEIGLQKAVTNRPDAIVFDLDLRNADGMKVLRLLRESTQAPVLVLSVNNREQDIVDALDNGANDHVEKPFGPSELLARLRVLLRAVPRPSKNSFFVDGDLKIDLSSRTVTIRNQVVRLTATEYALLCALVQDAGKVITHKRLLRTVWGSDAENESLYLRVYMTHLRKKLEAHSDQKRIVSEYGVGYRLATTTPGSAE